MSKENIIQAIGVSDGVSYAKCLCIKKPAIDVHSSSNWISKNIALEKLDEAIAKTQKQLERIKVLSKEKLGEEKSSIFDAHIQMANDPEMLNQIKEKMVGGRVNLVKIIDDVFDQYHEMFTKMDDPYFKERASDLIDVKERILCNVLDIEIPNLLEIKTPTILISNDLQPSNVALLDPKFVKGIISEVGGKTSHSAIMARSFEIPGVFGAKNILDKVKNGQFVGLDGKAGIIDLNPDEKVWLTKIEKYKEMVAEFAKYIKLETKTLDGKKIKCEANIGNISDVDGANKYGCEGVGLYRTEFLYMGKSNWPTEEEQFNAYKDVLSCLGNRLVVIRTLDIGGDKKLPYYIFEHEMNPFLGIRAIRFCLAHKEIFKTQLRALGRASVYGRLAIMFPMIANIEEFKKAKEFTLSVFEELRKEGIKVSDNILIGMMVEIPSTAILADKFAEYSDFFSIGTNDLIQYSFAADRMSKVVGYLYQPNNPALLRLISLTIKGGHSKNRFVGMCGEMAGDIQSIPILIGLGLDDFSMSASSIPQARKIINSLSVKECEKLANKALECSTAEEVNNLVKQFLKQHNL